MNNYLKGFIVFIIALVALLYVLKITAPDPKFNLATFEETPLQSGILPTADGWTLAQTVVANGSVRTLLVTNFDADSVSAIDLKSVGGAESTNPFEVFASFTEQELAGLVNDESLSQSFAFSALVSVAGNADRHLAIGTNFPEHAEEAQSDSVFNFPKFGVATPARTSVDLIEGGLLDYEVELCLRFDRPIQSLEDFDAASKGFFLCGDFTERATLLRLIDTDNLDSGTGFSDGKSGPGFFPSGALLVIPHDWQSFITNERMTTAMNGEPRQDARGGEMIYDFRALTSKVLSDMDKPRFLFKDDYVKLAPSNQIDQDMILMSGTSEGVIFTTPTRADFINALFTYIRNGAMFEEASLYDTAIESFLGSEYKSGHFMQPGDQIEFNSSSLGNIVVDVE
ncbi:MAG: fumarylacetoacetate hydrolase family protein [Arenicella sp.]|jgi:2-keto-4-pentenoate hydratase/2-oxohepta-3-ene-1,7-dioic acid hydratase in catechol pathway|nr:fumarylacetoacetate hydrolase family protein [Arenicella sp.]